MVGVNHEQALPKNHYNQGHKVAIGGSRVVLGGSWLV